MKFQFIIYKLVFIFCLIVPFKTLAQLGFCNGNSGDSIFSENFGTGTTNNALPAGTTTYNYINNFPNDGFYTVTNGSFGNPYDWHQTEDHTSGDTNGKFLIVNAGTFPGEFYNTTITGLCETTTYEFSAWLLNLVIANSYCSTQPSGTKPINVRFEIWDNTDSNLLASGDTGNIIETSTPNWQQFGLVFQTPVAASSVILKMINNGNGGCGNDLAIDDIVFKSCGDNISINDSTNNNNITLCSSQTPYSTTLTVNPDNSVFSSHFYQWEESNDGVTWSDISGENSQNISLTNITASGYYRVKVAESIVNLNNDSCNVTSEVYQVIINQLPVQPTIECWETATINTVTCNWDVTGSQPPQPTGLECWETITFNTSTCNWDIIGTQPIQPTLECWENATFNTSTCSWEITGTQPIQPSIECWETTTFNDTTCSWDILNIQPEIDNISSNGNSIIITVFNPNELLYSIDGINFQSDNIFYDVESGAYSIYIKSISCDEPIITEYVHFFIQPFFTPNNDGENDAFEIKGLENYNSSEVYIYDRLGKLLVMTKNSDFSWDGIYNGKPLPSSDYWYVLIIDGDQYSGHITLKR